MKASASSALIAALLCIVACSRTPPDVPSHDTPQSEAVAERFLVEVSEEEARVLSLEVVETEHGGSAVVPVATLTALIAAGDQYNDMAIDTLLRLVEGATEIPKALQATILDSAKRWASHDSAIAHERLAWLYARGKVPGDVSKAAFHAREAFRLNLLLQPFHLPSTHRCTAGIWSVENGLIADSAPICTQPSVQVQQPVDRNAIEEPEFAKATWVRQLDQIAEIGPARCGWLSPGEEKTCLDYLEGLASAERAGLPGAGIRAVIAALEVLQTVDGVSGGVGDVGAIRSWLNAYTSSDGGDATKLASLLVEGYRSPYNIARRLPENSDVRSYIERDPRAQLYLIGAVAAWMNTANDSDLKCQLLSTAVSTSPNLQLLSPYVEAMDVSSCVLQGRGGFVRNRADASRLVRFALLSGSALDVVRAKYLSGISYPVELATGRSGEVDLSRAVFWGTLLLEEDEFQAIEEHALSSLGPARFAEMQRAASAFKGHRPRVVWSQLEHIGLLSIDETVLGVVEGTDVPSESSTKSGTGFYVTADGAIVSNAHVVNGCAEVREAATGSPLSVVAIDLANDLAILRRPDFEPESPIPLRFAATVLGEQVVTLGYPLPDVGAAALTVTTGEVSALGGPGGDSRLIQISAPVQPGSSGGPVLDSNGRAIGVVTLTFGTLESARTLGAIPQNVNYAIRASTVRGFLESQGIVDSLVVGRSDELAASTIASRYSSSVVRVTCSQR